MSSSSQELGWGGIFGRFAFALALVYATWNPSGKSFAHWVLMPLFGRGGEPAAANAPVKFLLGIALLVGWVLFLQATRRSLGLAGAALVAAVCGGIVWLLAWWKVIDLHGSAIAHVVLVAVAIVLTMGMCWSHISRKLSGQMDTDTVG